MFTSYLQTTGQNRCIKVANRSFDTVAKLKYFGMTVTNQNYIHEKIKIRLNSGNACLFINCENLDKSLRRVFTTVGRNNNNNNKFDSSL
jgi:hypothetical protein